LEGVKILGKGGGVVLSIGRRGDLKRGQTLGEKKNRRALPRVGAKQS